MCLALGGKQVEDVTEYEDIEYYIACDDTESFRRTFSVMVALGTAKYIVTSRWMIESFEAKEVLPAHNYLVPDSVTKARYGFSISTTLANAKSNRPGGLLSGKYVYCSPGTLGKQTITVKQMETLVVLFGGTLIATQAKLSDAEASNILIVIVSDQKLSRKLGTAKEKGARLFTWPELLLSITNQQLAPLPPPAHKTKPSEAELEPHTSAKTPSQARDRPNLMSPSSQLKYSCGVIERLGFKSNFGVSTSTQDKEGDEHSSKSSPKVSNDRSPESANKRASGKQPSTQLGRIKLKLPSQQAKEKLAAEAAAAEALKKQKDEHKQELSNQADLIDAMKTEMLACKAKISSLEGDLARKVKDDSARKSTGNSAGEVRNMVPCLTLKFASLKSFLFFITRATRSSLKHKLLAFIAHLPFSGTKLIEVNLVTKASWLF